MGYKSIISVLANQNATETTKTLVDTINVPQGVRALVGVGTQFSAAGMTTLEDVGGVLELESDDMSPWGGTQAFLTGVIIPLTSGAIALNPYMHACNIPVVSGSKIKASMTFNRAQAINPATRVQMVFE